MKIPSLLLLAALAIFTPLASQASDKKPNILIITALQALGASPENIDAFLSNPSFNY